MCVRLYISPCMHHTTYVTPYVASHMYVSHHIQHNICTLYRTISSKVYVSRCDILICACPYVPCYICHAIVLVYIYDNILTPITTHEEQDYLCTQ